MTEAWGTPDANEQILWAFAHQDYAFVIDRAYERLSANQAQYVHVQLMVIALQRSDAEENARAFAENAIVQLSSEPWAAACLRLTLGDTTTADVLALARTDVERWRTWFYAWSRSVTTWRRQEARLALRECDAIRAQWEAEAGRTAVKNHTIVDVPCPEVLVLEIAASHFAPEAVANPSLTGSGVAIVGKKKELRLFVSSTFRDLEAEREHLAKRVFPQIRALCEERGVWFSDIDLRWGVTNEEAAEGDVLPICLAAIDQCRPHFVGILGNRYGWQPDAPSVALLDRYPWLHAYSGHSITDIEFRHGALNEPAVASDARFYFRSGGETDDRDATLLAMLRNDVRSRGMKVVEFKSPEELGAFVEQDLRATIDRRFPVGSTSTFLDDEHTLHEHFALERAEVYVGRWSYAVALDNHAAGTAPPLAVLGGGRGVSSVLADWGRRYRTAHPDVLVLLHFVGASAASVQWPSIVDRITGEITRRTGFMAPRSTGTDVSHRLLQLALEHAAAQTRVVLVLDGLHELDPSFGGRDLHWLPATLPENVRLIVSSSDVEQIRVLAARCEGYLEIEPLDVSERTTLVREYLHRWTKTLDGDCVNRIATADATASPWFLRVLLEELRVSGSHEALPALIDEYLETSDLVVLLQRVFARLERDYEARRPGLVGDALRLLWASRRGRTERQMLDFIGRDGEPLAQRDWLPLRMAMESWIHGPQDDLRLPNWAFRTAVEQHYLPTPADQRAAHAMLAMNLAGQPLDNNILIEHPWQLCKAEQWQELATLLATPGVFGRAWTQGADRVKEYWTRIEAASPVNRLDAYAPFLREPAAHDVTELAMLSQFLTETGFTDAAVSLQHAVTSMRDPEAAADARFLAEEARTAYIQHDFDRALRLYREEETIHRRAGDVVNVTRSRCNQALVLKDQGDLETALTLQREGERFWRERGDWAGLALALGNQGVIHSLRQDPATALTCHDEELQVYTTLDHQAGRQRAQSNRGNALKALGRYDEALIAWHEAASICRALGNLGDLAAVLHNEAMFWLEKTNPAPALPLLRESAPLFVRLGQAGTAAWDYHYLGEIAQKAEDGESALAAYRESARLFQTIGDRQGELAGIANQARILHLTKRPQDAIVQYREMERLARESGDASLLMQALANQGSLLVGPLMDPRGALVPLTEAATLLQRPELESFRQSVLGLLTSAHNKLAR